MPRGYAAPSTPTDCHKRSGRRSAILLKSHRYTKLVHRHRHIWHPPNRGTCGSSNRHWLSPHTSRNRQSCCSVRSSVRTPPLADGNRYHQWRTTSWMPCSPKYAPKPLGKRHHASMKRHPQRLKRGNRHAQHGRQSRPVAKWACGLVNIRSAYARPCNAPSLPRNNGLSVNISHRQSHYTACKEPFQWWDVRTDDGFALHWDQMSCTPNRHSW